MKPPLLWPDEVDALRVDGVVRRDVGDHGARGTPSRPRRCAARRSTRRSRSRTACSAAFACRRRSRGACPCASVAGASFKYAVLERRRSRRSRAAGSRAAPGPSAAGGTWRCRGGRPRARPPRRSAGASPRRATGAVVPVRRRRRRRSCRRLAGAPPALDEPEHAAREQRRRQDARRRRASRCAPVAVGGTGGAGRACAIRSGRGAGMLPTAGPAPGRAHYVAPPMGICEGRVVIVTGAGRGIGRGHALEFARQGAKVVVNDLGAELDGSGGVHRTGRRGGRRDPGDGRRGRRQRRRRRRLGRARSGWCRPRSTRSATLDVLVNNAGFLRDRMVVSTSEDEWDAVIRVHLKGHFAPTRAAGAFWREQQKAGVAVDARVINTSSGAGLMGSVGQGAYSAAKAGHRRAHDGGVGRARPLRRDRQRDRAGGAHADDRGGVRRHDGRARRRRVRRHGAGERRAARGVARLDATRPA